MGAQPKFRSLNGGKAFHARLAPLDAQHGQEVQVKVFKLQGVLHQCVFDHLSLTPARQIFTKPVTHALVKIAWGSYKWMFLLDLLHQCLATAVLSYWSWGSLFYPIGSLYVRRLLWSLVASYGLSTCIIFVLSAWKWFNDIDDGFRFALSSWKMGLGWLRAWLKIFWYKGLVGIITVLLAVDTMVALERRMLEALSFLRTA